MYCSILPVAVFYGKGRGPTTEQSLPKMDDLLCYITIHMWELRHEWKDKPRSVYWSHNGRDSVSNHQPHDCLLNRLIRRISKKTSKLRVTGLCAGNSPGTGEFPAQMASKAENVSIWWRHHISRKLSSGQLVLTHLSLGPHRYVSLNWVIIGLGTGLSLAPPQAIILTNHIPLKWLRWEKIEINQFS